MKPFPTPPRQSCSYPLLALVLCYVRISLMVGLSPNMGSKASPSTRELWPVGPRPTSSSLCAPHLVLLLAQNGPQLLSVQLEGVLSAVLGPHRVWQGVGGVVSLNPSLLLLSWWFEPARPGQHGNGRGRTLHVLGLDLGGGRDGMHWPPLWSRNCGVGQPVGGRS